MSFFSQLQTALSGPTGAPQSADETIGKLADRLGPELQLADRRAAAQALRGLVKGHKEAVGSAALSGLLAVLGQDAQVDETAARAALDALGALCATDDGQRELGLRHAGQVLETEGPVRELCSLLSQDAFYVRHGALQLLGTLLGAKRQVVQAHFLVIQHGASTILSALDDKREIVRNEALSVLQALTQQSADVQKVMAFEGAFDRLFTILQSENGVDGGLTSRDALLCIDSLLRFNSSNQSFFRETPFPPVLCSLLLYPPALPTHEPAPQEFALQFWDAAKAENFGLVVGLVGMLANAKGGSPQEFAAFIRCLIELALGSNAPTPIKTQCLTLLPSSGSGAGGGAELPLSSLLITAYVPVPDTNGEEWDRLEPASALDALVELVIHGEYAGQYGARMGKADLGLRAAALSVFEAFVRKPELKLAILQAMLPPSDDGTGAGAAPLTPLLSALIAPPGTAGQPDAAALTATQFSALLFAHLLRSAPEAKALARAIVPPKISADAAAGGGAFFVPADGGAPPPPPPPEDDDDDPPQPLLAILAEHLSLALLQRARADQNGDTPPEDARAWDRLLAGYLALLAQWLWDDPAGVKEFLGAGALGMLVERLNAPGAPGEAEDALIPGLCAFLLGVCYEFDREAGEITRATIHPILTRLGVDSLVGRMTRLREDERVRALSPEDIVLPAPASFTAAPFASATEPSAPAAATSAMLPSLSGAGAGAEPAEVWFDWAFVDFWKSNYYVIQRGIAVDPDSISSAASQNQEAAMLAASLREVIKTQAQQIEALQAQLQQAHEGARLTHAGVETARRDADVAKHEADAARREVESLKREVEAAKAEAMAAKAAKAAPPPQAPVAPSGSSADVTALEAQLATLRVTASDAEARAKETEKEQEDLLVLLDELNSKRARDKARMRGEGMEVSEDEEEEDDEEEE